MSRSQLRFAIELSILLTTGVSAASAQAPTRCNSAASASISHLTLPGNPFTPLPSPDGCWIFVTLARPNPTAEGGVAVVSRSDVKLALVRTFPLTGGPTGAVLTHDGKLLIVTTGPAVAFLDVARLESGKGAPVLGYLDFGKPVASIFANVTRDDRYLFVSLERAFGIAVIDLDKARKTGFDITAVVGVIPTGNSPIALTFSTDERWLYTTSQAAPAALKWPVACKPEGQPTAAPNHPLGAILIVDVERAKTDPEHSVAAAVAAGCNPVRLALSPDGNVLYATARGDYELRAYDTRKLLADSAHALLGRVPVGTAPVGIAVFDSGGKLS